MATERQKVIVFKEGSKIGELPLSAIPHDSYFPRRGERFLLDGTEYEVEKDITMSHNFKQTPGVICVSVKEASQ